MDFTSINLKDGVDNIWWLILKPLLELIIIIVLFFFFLLHNLSELDISQIDIDGFLFSDNLKRFIDFYYLSGVFPFLCIALFLLTSNIIKWLLIIFGYNLPFYFEVRDTLILAKELTFDQFCKIRFFLKDTNIDIKVIIKYIRAIHTNTQNTYSTNIKNLQRKINDVNQRMHMLKGLVYLELMMILTKYLLLRTKGIDFSLEWMIVFMTIVLYFQSLRSNLVYTKELVEKEIDAFFEIKNIYENYSKPSNRKKNILENEFSNIKFVKRKSSINFAIQFTSKKYAKEIVDILFSITDYIDQKIADLFNLFKKKT